MTINIIFYKIGSLKMSFDKVCYVLKHFTVLLFILESIFRKLIHLFFNSKNKVWKNII